MTSEIEGQQGDNPFSPDYEPMRPDDPHDPQDREPIALGSGEQQDWYTEEGVAPPQDADPEIQTLLNEASDLAVAALAIPERERLGYTPVPEGGVITDQFLVHDDDPDPRRRRLAQGAADPHALMYIGTQYQAPAVLVAFLTEGDAISWASSTPGRRLWKVRVVTFDQPMVVVRIPEQLELMTEDEAKTHGQLEHDDD